MIDDFLYGFFSSAGTLSRNFILFHLDSGPFEVEMYSL